MSGWILNILGMELGPGLDVKNKEMRRVKDDCASGFSYCVAGCVKYWKREGLGKIRFVTRGGMGLGVKKDVLYLRCLGIIQVALLGYKSRSQDQKYKFRLVY